MFNHLDCEVNDPNSDNWKVQMQAINNNLKDENVEIVYEFDFMIFENFTKEELLNAGWDTESQPTQHIYISSDRSRLLEVINGETAIIYKGTTIDVHDEFGKFTHRRILWQKENHIPRFPKMLQNDIPINFLFSHNFTFYLDFNYKQN